MQVDLKDNPVYRMRYNQSALTIEHSPKNKHFDYSSIPKIISIMICDFDLFKLGKPVYEIERTIKTTSIIVDNGVRELYVNLKADVKTNKLKELFKILTEYEYLDEKTFPNLTEKKKELSGKLKGENKMTGISREIYMDGKAEGILEGKTEGKAEGVLEGWRDALVELYKQNMISKEYAANKLKMTIDEFLELAKK